MFLTVTSLFSFYSLNSYFTTIFLFINISVRLLSKSTSTVMPSYISIFFISMFNYTFLNILNILLTSLCLSFPFTVLFGTPVCILHCCTFPCLEHTTTLQSYHGCFLFVLYSRYRILSLSSFDISATIFLHSHQVYFTLTAPSSFAKFSLYLYTSRH